MRFLLDTNVLIEHLQGSLRWEPIFRAFAEGEVDLSISVMTEFELFAFPKITTEEEAAAILLIQGIHSYIIDQRIAHTAALLRRNYQRAPLDLLIAATALTHNLPILTRNIRDFRQIEGLTVYNIFPNS